MTTLAITIDGQGPVTADQLNSYEFTCDTLAILRSFVGQSGMQVFVRGQSAPSDGLGGAFWWNVGSTAADDNLNTIVPGGSGSGAWNRLIPQRSVLPTVVSWGVAGTYSWTPPAGVTSVWVEYCVGAGGGGASCTASISGGCGGAGGTARGLITVTPGLAVTIIVGAGGLGGAAGGNNGGNGGNSSIGGLVGNGGGNGGIGAGVAPGGLGGSGTGPIVFIGGNGSEGNINANSPNMGVGGASALGGGGRASTIPNITKWAPGSGGGASYQLITSAGGPAADGYVEIHY